MNSMETRNTSDRLSRIAIGIALAGLTLLAATRAQAQWAHLGQSGSAYGICVHGDTLFSGIQSDGLYRSIDHGDTWALTGNGVTSTSNWWLEEVGGALFCGTQFGSAFRSTDHGVSWSDIGLNGARGFMLHNDTLYACEWYMDKVHWSVDMGATWTETASLTDAGGLWPMAVYNGYLYVGAQTGGIRRLAHATGSWATMNDGLGNLTVYALAVLGDTLFAAGGDGVHYTTDGQSWTSASVDISGVVYALHAMGHVLYAGHSTAGVWRSTDGGTTWSAMNEGLNDSQVVRITSDGAYLYAGTLGSGVFRYAVQGGGTGEAESDERAILLFPNPATDRIMVRSTDGVPIKRVEVLSARGEVLVTARINDIQGLVDVGALAGGVYMVRLRTPGGTSVQRLVIP